MLKILFLGGVSAQVKSCEARVHGELQARPARPHQPRQHLLHELHSPGLSHLLDEPHSPGLSPIFHREVADYVSDRSPIIGGWT